MVTGCVNFSDAEKHDVSCRLSFVIVIIYKEIYIRK